MGSKCCCKGCFKLCPISLGIALGLTAMLGLWAMLMWGAYSTGETMSVHMQQMMTAMGGVSVWQVYLGAFLRGFFAGFFIALFYDICRWFCWKVCGSKCSSNESCDMKK